MRSEYDREYWPTELNVKTEWNTGEAANSSYELSAYPHWDDFFNLHINSTGKQTIDAIALDTGYEGDGVVDFNFYKKNTDRLELLVRKFSENQYPQQTKEENARLMMLEREVELLNPRYSDSDFENLATLSGLVRELQQFD